MAGTVHQEIETLTSENIIMGENMLANDDYDSDNDQDGKVKVIEQNQWKWSQIRCLAFTLLSIVIIASIVIFTAIYLNGKTKASDPDNDKIKSYVLPNTTLAILVSSDTVIKGKFVVDNESEYTFVSISNQSIEYIEFKRISVSNEEEWRGFQIYHLDEGQITLTLIHSNDNTQYSITIGRAGNMSFDDTKILESFLSNILCQHFVELSIKLGAMGYLGNINHAIQDIHRFAQWIWSVVLDDDNINNSEWVDISEELEKVNTVNLASKNAGYDIKTMNELMIYSSNMMTWNTINSGRKLLGNCGSPYSYCNNDCFGMCGKGCSCWSSVCGDCDCWLGCVDHDRKCCDNGYFSYCCLNIFWVECDGSGSCS